MQHCDNDMVDICSVLLSLETEHNIFEWNPKIDQDLSETGSSNQQMKGCEDGQSHGEKVAKKSSAPVIHSHQAEQAFTVLGSCENGAACS